MSKKYLFVCGCPRSGTTALWHLLTAHPQIVLGIERYILLAYKKGSLQPALFEESKFFDLQPDETYYSDLVKYNKYYQLAADKYRDATWIGDKIPPLDLDYGAIEANFENAHILYIVHNIIDVAASYQKRANDPNDATWNPTRNYRKAVHDWHHSLRETLRFHAEARRTSIKIVLYDDLFLQSSDLGPIFDWLGLGVTSGVLNRDRALLARSKQLDNQRGDGLNSAQRQYLAVTAPFGLYRQVIDRRLSLPVCEPG